MLLDQLYVLKEHHGAGIAQVLMDWALDEAARRGIEDMYLTVFVDNTARAASTTGTGSRRSAATTSWSAAMPTKT